MARIFISHSSANSAEALALRDWLVARGWDDLFLDIDPHRGLVSGQRWLDQLQASAQRCKAVLFVLSRAWLSSRYCTAEFWEARKQDRPLFAVVIDDTAVADVPAEMRGVWQLAFLTRGSRFETFPVLPPPDYAPTEVRFSHEGLESLRLGLVQAGLTSFDTASFPWPAPGFEHEADGTTPRRPYRGLKPVDVPDAGVFFGRDADLVRARDQLADLRDRGGRCVVVILGASGSGKSSFLRAGLLPRLARDDRRFLPLPILRPRGAAMWGDEGLLAALETAHQQAGLAVTRATLRADLEVGGAGFLRRLADLRSAAGDLPEDAKPPTLVLSIDQAEESFTTVRGDRPGETGAAEAGLFLIRLAEMLRHGPEALALVTIRSDAYEPLQTTEALAGVPQVPFNLPPLAAADYRGVIDGPAHRATEAGRSLTLEPGLAAALLADAQGADALPLLGFTMERLYVEHGGDGDLTRVDYGALGGVQGSIEAAVAEAFADPDAAPRIPAGAAEREALLRRAFVPYLMGVNESNGEPVRRTTRLADLPEAARGLIDRLIDRRLLVVDRRGEETVVEVAHEALLRLWPPLRRWHDQERASLETQQEIAHASSAWSQNMKGSDWLAHRGARLAEAEAVARREDFAAVFAGLPHAYLDACRQAEDAARDAEALRLTRQRVMQRRVGILLIVVAIVTLAGGWLVVAGRRDLARQRSKLIANNAKEAFEAGQYDRAMRLALVASPGSWFSPSSADAGIQLGRAAHFSRLEAQLTGHKGWVRSVAFSPDGRRLITTSWKTVLVWSQGEDGAWTCVSLEGHQASVNSASFSSDGARIITASSDKTARVWSRGEGDAWSSVALEGHQGQVTSASFSPDGARIVTASDDGTTRVWNQGKNEAWTSVDLVDQKEEINSVAFSPDGTRLVTTSWKTVLVWSQGKDGSWTSDAMEGRQGPVFSASFSPNGARFVTTSFADTAQVWSRGKDAIWTSSALEGHQEQVTSASFSPDGARIVTASADGTARVWSRGNDGAWASVALKGHQDGVTSASFSPDGSLIITASKDRTARVWSRSEDGAWANVTLRGHRDEVYLAAFSPDGTHIVTASKDHTARLWGRGEDGDWTSVSLEDDHVVRSSAAFSPDGAHIASGGETARVWSRGKDGAWTSVTLERNQVWVISEAFSPDGARIVTASTDKTARVWSRGKGGAWTSVALEGHQDAVISAAFSPDSALIVTASADKTARVWNRGRNGTWTSVVLKGHQDWVSSAAFSPDGARIVTASGDKTARVWSRGKDGAWTSVALEGHQDAVISAAFSSDGARIVTASGDKTARVWSRGEDGVWTNVALEGHQDTVRSAAFSLDGTRIITASDDNTARVWSQGEDGAWTSVALEGHQGTVNSAAISPDGTHIITASEDKTVRLWNVRWLMGPDDWAKAEPLSLPETVCREKLHGSWTTVKDPKTGRQVERIAERLLTADDIQASPILAGREGEDVCAPFLEPRPWWSRLSFWR
ncbi:MAG TPA: TIR domain-containing protein [Thermoanaerobaculia bacterium]|jgi:WD40 repeat protein|nr:TIR domain-containing protein [Thermoanaerobaculia bacterium]